MANTSEEIRNSTLHILSSLTFGSCLKGNYFGLIFCYLTMTLCLIFGTPAHLWCLWFYFCTKRKIKETQVFFLNHTIMEIIFCMKYCIEILNMLILQDGILWGVISFIFGLSWTGRPLFQTCTCIEQYLAVIHPVTFMRYKGIQYRIAPAVGAWLMSLAYGLYKLHIDIFPEFIYTSVFFIALIVISFCCVSVLCALKRPGPGGKHITNQTGRDEGNQKKRKAFNTIFSALLLILFTYLPQVFLVFFTGTEAYWTLFKCNITFSMTALNNVGVIITPWLKIYKESHFKMSKLLNGN